MIPPTALAERLGVRFPNPTAASALGLPAEAGPGDLSFLLEEAPRANAGGALVRGLTFLPARVPALIVANPLVACARAADRLPVYRPGDADSPLDEPGASVAENCVLGRGVYVREGARIGAGCVPGRGARIGAHSDIAPGVKIGAGICIGNRVRVASGAVIGGDALLAVRDGPRWVRSPAFAAVVIEDDTRVGSHVAVSRGVSTHTRIGARTMLDSHVHVGHDTIIEADTITGAGRTLGGSVRVGKGCVMCGRVAVGEGLAIADGVVVETMCSARRSAKRVHAGPRAGLPSDT